MKELKPNLLFDSLDSYEWHLLSTVPKEDDKGKYDEKTFRVETPCNCHPETCCHFDGKTTKIEVTKKYKKH